MSSLILIVDDDRTMRSLLRLAMEEEGYRVVEAENGAQCLAEFNHFQPDLILLDAVMPDIDGFTCCQKIRSLLGGDPLPILLITVLDDQESVEQAFEQGATDYITKPICWSILSYRVRRLLESQTAWTKLSHVSSQLEQQKNWQQLVSNILAGLTSQDNPSNLRDILDLIRQWSQGIRVCLSSLDLTFKLESLTAGYPSIKEISPTQMNLISQYGEQYQQGTPIVIENISQANWSSVVMEQLQQSNIQSLAIVPIEQPGRLWGWLEIHFSQRILPNNGLSPNHLIDLANFLQILITDN